MSSKRSRKQRQKQQQKSKTIALNKSQNIPNEISAVSEDVEVKESASIDTEIMEKKPRESLSKKIRFEVFKRDSFKCQYCGRSAPDVILNVDHIKPVAEGGTNDIMNLITSCFDCNNGKRDKLLSDNTIIQKQYNELEKLNERREQLEMMIEWRETLEGLQNVELEYFEKVFDEKFNRTLTPHGKKNVTRMIKKYGLNLVFEKLEAIYLKDIKDVDYITVLEKYLKVADAEKEKPYLKDLFYIRKILDNKFELDFNDKRRLLKVIEDRILNNYNIEWLKECAQDCNSLWQFYKWLED
jgi:5-methylcytosine-specific restriction endonuclease McrA